MTDTEKLAIAIAALEDIRDLISRHSYCAEIVTQALKKITIEENKRIFNVCCESSDRIVNTFGSCEAASRWIKEQSCPDPYFIEEEIEDE